MSQPPRAVIGVPLYNHAHQLEETLESLLSQTYAPFAVVLSDDQSTDGTAEICRRFAERYPNVLYFCADRRLGYIANARRVFALSREHYPEAEFFAWGSDHDLWHPHWLERLVRAFDAHPEAVAAIPFTMRIDEHGKTVFTRGRRFHTIGIRDPARRLFTTFRNAQAGNMIYGLLRAKAVEGAGVMPRQLTPDRLLLSRLALDGPTVQVPEYLWYRRYSGLFSFERQIKASFFDHRPAYLSLPWYVAHAGWLFNRLVLRRSGAEPVGRAKGLLIAAIYPVLGFQKESVKGARRLLYHGIKKPLVAFLREDKPGGQKARTRAEREERALALEDEIRAEKKAYASFYHDADVFCDPARDPFAAMRAEGEAPARGKRLLFAMWNVGYVRNFDMVMRRLLESGYQIVVVIDNAKLMPHARAAIRYIMELVPQYPGLVFVEAQTPPFQARVRTLAARYLRTSQDLLRYLDPVYASADKLRERAYERVRPILRPLLMWLGAKDGRRRKAVHFLSYLDGLLPAPAHIRDLVEKIDPDVVMVTPLLGIGSPQPDYYKAARSTGARTCLPVASWDNLTNKGLIHVKPDMVLVWNEAQRREAMDLHGIAPGGVVATGAHTYDHWFDWKPSTTLAEFNAQFGFPPERPFILYLGSSNFIAPNEPDFVIPWLRALRSSDDPALRSAPILIRPHPQNATDWETADLSEFSGVIVHPRGGSNPVAVASKTDYFDTLYHSGAVVGVNTSGMIEAGILGKPIHALTNSAYAGTQEGTLHFKHLSREDGGLLYTAETYDRHIGHLGRALSRKEALDPRSRGFIERFVRPYGLAEEGTPRFVEAVKTLASLPKHSPLRFDAKRFAQQAVFSPLLLICVPEHVRYLTPPGIRQLTRPKKVVLWLGRGVKRVLRRVLRRFGRMVSA